MYFMILAATLNKFIIMKPFLILILLFISSISFSQIKVEFKNFSDDYYAVITIADTNNIDKPGKITIYDKKSNAELIGVKFSGKILEFHYGNILDNITELLYEEQSLIIYKDFNFDGVKDFALQDGFKGNYSSATYRIFLANKGQFILNKDFTELSQYNFGMFEVDYEKKILKTFIKDGCCWHEYSEYIVENNVPEVAAIITEDATKDDEYVYITEKRLVDGKWITKERKELIKDYYKEDE